MSSICSQCSETGLLNELTRMLLLPTMRQSQRQVPCWCLSMAKVSPLQLISLTESRALLCLFCWLLSSLTVLPMASAHIRLSDPLFPYRSVIADHGLLSNYTWRKWWKKGKEANGYPLKISTNCLIRGDRPTSLYQPHNQRMTRPSSILFPPSFILSHLSLWALSTLTALLSHPCIHEAQSPPTFKFSPKLTVYAFVVFTP